jgi:hypothetical protein
MFHYWKKNRLDSGRTRVRDRKRRVCRAPLASELEGRTLLSGAGAAHAAGPAQVPAHMSHAYLMFLARTEFGETGGSRAGQPHGGHGVKAALVAGRAARANTVVRLAVPGGPLAMSGTFAGTHKGTAIPGTNPGGGLIPSGYLGGPNDGTSLLGANPGGGPIPSGYLDGPNMGTSLLGANPGAGPNPSGALS